MRDGVFVAVAFNHLVVDLLNGQSGILLVFLAISLGLSNSDIGLVTLIYISVGSLTQPLFGLLADRPGSGRLCFCSGVNIGAVGASGADCWVPGLRRIPFCRHRACYRAGCIPDAGTDYHSCISVFSFRAGRTVSRVGCGRDAVARIWRIWHFGTYHCSGSGSAQFTL